LSNTIEQYNNVITKCRNLFYKKNKDYGTAWRILRPSSLTDQIFIKAKRIRSIEEKNGIMRIPESIEDEFVGIINYAIMALIQLENNTGPINLPTEEAMAKYEHWVVTTRDLMDSKNHDYGEAWRDMRVSSMTDLILMKLLRIKSIEENQGKTMVSEGLDANYQDIMNYAIFALIKIDENKIKETKV
jgi:hypothetical protein